MHARFLERTAPSCASSCTSTAEPLAILAALDLREPCFECALRMVNSSWDWVVLGLCGSRLNRSLDGVAAWLSLLGVAMVWFLVR